MGVGGNTKLGVGVGAAAPLWPKHGTWRGFAVRGIYRATPEAPQSTTNLTPSPSSGAPHDARTPLGRTRRVHLSLWPHASQVSGKSKYGMPIFLPNGNINPAYLAAERKDQAAVKAVRRFPPHPHRAR